MTELAWGILGVGFLAAAFIFAGYCWLKGFEVDRHYEEPLHPDERHVRIGLKCRGSMCQEFFAGLLVFPDGIWTNEELDQAARRSGWVVSEGVTMGGDTFRYVYCPTHHRQYWGHENCTSD